MTPVHSIFADPTAQLGILTMPLPPVLFPGGQEYPLHWGMSRQDVAQVRDAAKRAVEGDVAPATSAAPSTTTPAADTFRPSG